MRNFFLLAVLFLPACSVMSTKTSKTAQTSSAEKREEVGLGSAVPKKAQCTPTRTEEKTRLAIRSQPSQIWNVQSKTSPSVIPDFAIRGFKTSRETCLFIPHYELSMICGSSFDTLKPLPSTTYTSPSEKTFPNYNYKNWIASPYAVSDDKILALAHSEWYQCLNFENDPAKKCSVGNNQMWSWSNAISSFQSSDSGRSWIRLATLQRPAAVSDNFPALWAKSMQNFGFFHPGNIIFEDGYYYAFAKHVDRNMDNGEITKNGLILMRSKELTADAWEQVSPTGAPQVNGFAGNVLPNTSTWDLPTVTFNKSLCKYLLTYWDYALQKTRYTTFDSLAKPVFGPLRDVENQDLVKIPGNERANGFVAANYATSQIDPDSSGRNFEFTDDSFFLHMSSFTSANVMERNLYRVDVQLTDADKIPQMGASAVMPKAPQEEVIQNPLKPLEMPVANGGTVAKTTPALKRIYRSNKGDDFLHGATTNEAILAGYTLEGPSFQLSEASLPDTAPLYRCLNSTRGAHFLSLAANCEGAGNNEGALGFIFTKQIPGTVPLIRCSKKAALFHLSTIQASECSAELYVNEGRQGFVFP